MLYGLCSYINAAGSASVVNSRNDFVFFHAASQSLDLFPTVAAFQIWHA